MTGMNLFNHWQTLLIAVSLGCAIGCSHDQQVASIVASKNDSNIRRLANLYQSFQLRHGSQGPKDQAEFQAFIEQFPAHRLKMMQIDPTNIAQLFVSERDGQAFRVRYEIGGGMGWIVPVIFEQQGDGGVRQVAFTNGSVEEVADDGNYHRLLEDPGRSKMETKTSSSGSSN